MKFAPVAARLGRTQGCDQLRGFNGECGQRRGNRLLQTIHQRPHFGIRAGTGFLHLARLLIERSERGSQRIEHIFNCQFLCFQGQFSLVGLSSKLLLGQFKKGLRVGAQSVGSGSLEGRVQVRLHLRVLRFFVFDLLGDTRQLFRLGFQCRDFGLGGFALLAQRSLARFSQIPFTGAPQAKSQPKTNKEREDGNQRKQNGRAFHGKKPLRLMYAFHLWFFRQICPVFYSLFPAGVPGERLFARWGGYSLFPVFTHPRPPGRLEVSGSCAFFQARWLFFPAVSR